MGRTWMRCCERFRRRKRNQDADLDVRFGDMSISGPILGGWNQAPPSQAGKLSDTITNKHRAVISRSHSAHNSSVSLISSCCSSQDSLSATKEMGDSIYISNPEKPGFVYKPASDQFLKSIPGVGKPRRPAQLTVEPEQTYQRHLSVRSIRSVSSMEPSSPAAMPCHPYYHPEPLLPSPRPTPPTSYPRSPAFSMEQSIDRRRYYPSPDISEPDSIEDNGSYASRSYEPSLLQQLTPQSYPTSPLPEKQKKKKQKSRAVTEELVPSSTELFD